MAARRSYTELPWHLPGAAEFSADRDDFDRGWVVETLKRHPQWLDALVHDALPDGERRARTGRKRKPGSYALAYLAFVDSKVIDIEPWYAKSTAADWHAYGFDARPSYPTLYRRFCELEERVEAFEDLAGSLIRHARTHDQRVCQDLHVDSTEAETNACLVHACPEDRDCDANRREISRNAYAKEQGFRVRRRRSTDMDTKDIRAARQKQAELPEEQEPDEFTGDAVERSRVVDGRLQIQLTGTGCWWEVTDPTAGVRAYTKKDGAGRQRTVRFWVGFYNTKAVDHFTGGVAATHVFSASRLEHQEYETVLNKIIKNVGSAPRAVVADKGYSIYSVFERNTRAGIASVMPWRGTNLHPQPPRSDRLDEHGMPRCKHCGGTTRFVRFHPSAANGEPRLWMRCDMPVFESCKTTQSLYCREHWKLLTPIWKTSKVWHALWDTHADYERVHWHWRDRYCVAMDHHSGRPRRRGAPCQQLRASAAMVIDWLKILFRQGWLGSARRNRQEAVRGTGDAGLSRLLIKRASAKLHLRYGAAAKAAGLAGTARWPNGPKGPVDQPPPDPAPPPA